MELMCNLLKIHARFLSLSSSACSKFADSNKQAKILNKILSRDKKRRNKWYPAASKSESTTLFNVKQVVSTSKRVNVLNKLFMKNITELLATGEISPEILGKGLEISKVKMSCDFQNLSVFWIARGNDSDIEVSEILRKAARLLRHELSQLKLMGHVPPITFVKDRHQADLVKIDKLLTVADYGEDYDPIDQSLYERADIRSEDIKKFNSDVDENFNEEFPVMRQDIFGLNHEDIMKKIKMNMKKATAPHRTGLISLNNDNLNDTHTCNINNVTNEENHRAMLAKFLASRRHMNEKLKYTPKYDSEEDDMLESSFETEYENFPEELTDYIEEDSEIN